MYDGELQTCVEGIAFHLKVSQGCHSIVV